MSNISERISYLIEQLGISKKEFANTIGASAGNISDWCKGRSAPSYSAQKKIEKQFKVSLDWLNEGQGPIFIEKDELKIRNDENLDSQEKKILALFRRLSNEEKIKVEGILEMKVFEADQKTKSSQSISKTDAESKIIS